MNNKKIIFIDSEGTLRENNRKILPDTKNIIGRLRDKGVVIVVTSGLPRFLVRKVSKESSSSRFIISSNGADIYDRVNNIVIENSFFAKEIIEGIYKLSRENFNVILGLGDQEYSNSCNQYNEDATTISSINDFSDSILQCHISQKEMNLKDNIKHEIDEFKKTPDFPLMYQLVGSPIYHKLMIGSPLSERELELVIRAKRFLELKELRKLLLEKYGYDVNLGNQSLDFIKFQKYGELPWFSLNKNGVNKGSSILTLANKLHVKQKNTIAIGNDYNDLSMYETAGDYIDLGPNSNLPYHERKIGKVLEKIYRSL